MLSRCAIHGSGIAALGHNFQAISTFHGSPFRRAFMSASLHHSPAAARPAPPCQSDTAPAAHPPAQATPAETPTPPRHQPRFAHLNSPRKSSPRRHSIRSANTRCSTSMFRYAPLSQQSVQPQPVRTLFRLCQMLRVTAPGKSRQRLRRLEHLRWASLGVNPSAARHSCGGFQQNQVLPMLLLWLTHEPLCSENEM